VDELELYESESGAQFIRAWQGDKPAARSGRILAERLGMSPATVSVVLNEASVRHSPWPLDRVDPLIEVMGLSPALADFLWLLLRRDHAIHLRQRAELTLRIDAARQYRHGRRIDSEESRLLSSWHHLALFEMAHLAGLPEDPRTLSQLLVPSVSEGAMAEAIELNERQGLVTRKGGTLRAAEDHVLSLPEDKEKAAAVRRGMRRLHQWYLRRGCEALNEFPSEERFFHADLLMVPVSAVPTIHERVGTFHAELLLLAQQLREEASAEEEHQLQFLGIQVYPLSEKVRGATAEESDRGL